MARARTFGAVKLARTEGRGHRVAIRDQCREARLKLRDRARQLRENLSQAIKQERIALRGSCQTRLADARATTERAIQEARKTAMDLHRLKAAARTPAQQAAAEKARLRRALDIRESDDEVRRNLSDDLQIIWAKVKNRPGMRASKRRTRTEAFLDWLHNHPEIGERILIEHAEQRFAGQEETEEQYRARKRAEKPRGRRAAQLEEGIPF